ncbi:MAG TPA: hypothetical protein GXX55_00315 [Firmicutes bacterium]|nr:hypothetical protein [Bacillota bacterium]
MRRTFCFGLIILLAISPFGCSKQEDKPQLTQKPPTGENRPATDDGDELAIKSLVEDFGRALQTVYLQGPGDMVKKSINENYGRFVTPSLLAEWLNDPSNAPGRVVSSPWPDRIEIRSMKPLSEDTYELEGEIIEITSVEKVSGGAAARQPITLLVKKTGTRWLIDGVTLGYRKGEAG